MVSERAADWANSFNAKSPSGAEETLRICEAFDSLQIAKQPLSAFAILSVAWRLCVKIFPSISKAISRQAHENLGPTRSLTRHLVGNSILRRRLCTLTGRLAEHASR